MDSGSARWRVSFERRLRRGFCGFNLAIEIGERPFRHLTHSRIVNALQLLEDPLTRESKSLELPDASRLLGSELPFQRRLYSSCFRLLFLDRLTFPAASHI